ncbi:MAG: hypothetical protein WAX89_07940 [Alphaproteobacteria bacterium]
MTLQPPPVKTPIPWDIFQGVERDKALRRQVLFHPDGRLRHLLFSQQLSRSHLEHLFRLATAIRRLNKTRAGQDALKDTLRHQAVLNLFVQPSSRTVESFAAAEDVLGMSVRVQQDISTSSFAKGETVEDAVRTLSSYFDALVIRHEDDAFVLRAAYALYHSNREIPVVSGGSGSSQHVTQAILDIYTLLYSFAGQGGIDGKTVMLVADIARNRAARSLIYLLTKFTGVRIILVSPETSPPHRPAAWREPEVHAVYHEQARLYHKGQADTADLLAYLQRHNMAVFVESNIQDALKVHGAEIDALYMTRNQSEYAGQGWQKLDDYQLKWAYRTLLKPDCVIMHPLPRNAELPDQWVDETQWPRSVVWRQVRNGMWIRAAIFAELFGKSGHIFNAAGKLGIAL